MAVTFHTSLLQAAGMKATGIPVPDEVILQLGGSKKPALVVVVDDYSFRTTVGSMNGKYMIPVSAEHRAAAGLAAGDQIEVTVELDTAPRTVDVPDDLSAALDSTAGARAAFDVLAPSHRKAHVTSVLSAKTDETRARRIAAVVEKVVG